MTKDAENGPEKGGEPQEQAGPEFDLIVPFGMTAAYATFMGISVDADDMWTLSFFQTQPSFETRQETGGKAVAVCVSRVTVSRQQAAKMAEIFQKNLEKSSEEEK